MGLGTGLLGRSIGDLGGDELGLLINRIVTDILTTHVIDLTIVLCTCRVVCFLSLKDIFSRNFRIYQTI